MGSLSGGAAFRTYNETGSGGASASSSATITCRYNFSVTPNGVRGNGSPTFGKLYNISITANGAKGDGTNIGQKYVTITPTGGAYAAGTHTNTARFNSTIVTLGGVSGAGSATNNERYSFIPALAGVKVYGAYGERTTTPAREQTTPRPSILFEVVLYDYSNVVSFPQPDAISNLVRIREATKLNIPGVIEGLVHGDQFTLYGEEALEVQDSYSDFLTVISSE